MNKLKYYILILAVLQALKGLSQGADTLNKLNDKGVKTGYWKVFYNSKFEPIQDTTKAKYYGFDYFINGDAFRYPHDKKKEGKVKIDYIPKDSSKTGKFLNGTIMYYDSYKNLAYKDEFSNGIIIKAYSYSYFYDNSYVLYKEEFIDYTRMYNKDGTSYFHEVKDYKILKDKWVSKKEYVVFKNRNKQKIIKL